MEVDRHRPIFGAGWTRQSPEPVLRFLARILDGLVIGTPLWMALDVILLPLAPQAHALLVVGRPDISSQLIASMLSLVMLIPFSAVMIGLWGVTPGKLVFGVRVSRPDGRSIGVGAAFVREFRVWMIGEAFGIWFLNLGTWWLARSRLLNTGRTRWDQLGGHVVTHRPLGGRQDAMISLGIVAIVLGFLGPLLFPLVMRTLAGAPI